MREIKFRGWHAVQKKMYSAEEMASDQLTLLPTGQFINVSGEATWKSQIMPPDKFIPLQYTGLKDRNGKEIYEGDIIGIPSLEEEGTFEIGEVYWNDREAAWYVKTDESDDELNSFADDQFRPEDNCEVIGNIYENPELLEPEASK